jgi:hypothetical protein
MDDPETLRTISGLGPDSDPDYLVVKREAKTWTLQLLKRTGLGYTFDPAVTLDALAGPNDTLLPTRKIDWLGTGVPQIQISLSVIQTDPRKRSGRFLRFYIFDQNLGLVSKFEYLNTETVPTERFQMLKLAGTKNWAPAWISAGKAPPTEIPAYNPWKPYPIDRFEYRFYYLTQDSVLHSVQAPEKYTFIKLLFQTTDQRVAGEVPVLLSTGKDYYVKYATAVVRGNQVQDLKPLDLPQFQNLISVSPYNSLDVLSLDSSHSEVQGSLFFGKAHRGAIQISLIPALSGNAPLSGTLNPATFTDSMVSVTGAFFGEGKGSVFAQTHYELQYHDLISGQVALTSVNRYTFLPTFLSERSSYPVVISQSGKLTAGTYFPDGLGDTPSIEVVVPVESQGKISLGIPAKFRFLTTEACPLASNPIAPRAGNPSKLVLFCRDRFVRIPLIY